MKEKILIVCDHAGYELKVKITEYLKSKYDIVDYGAHDAEPVDYPDYAHKVSKEISKNKIRGILICGTGQGMAMVANKYENIRAGVIAVNESCEEITKLLRNHNDCNVLCLGARFLTEENAKKVVDIFLNTEFDGNKPGGERHKRRVEKIKVQETL